MEITNADQRESADFDAIVAVLQKALSEQIEAINAGFSPSEAENLGLSNPAATRRPAMISISGTLTR